MSEPNATTTLADVRRVEWRATVKRADGRTEELGLIAGWDKDEGTLAPDPRPVGVEHRAAILWVTERVQQAALFWTTSAVGADPDGTARAIVDELFRFGPIVPDGTPGARTAIPGGEA